MSSFYLTNAAKSDLKEIGNYTQREWGRAQRDQYLTMLDGYFHDLASNPLIGRDCSEVRAGYRKLSAGSHLIFYRPVKEGVIEIVRILHARMDTDRHL
ncbi:Toxin ParE1 [Candidatus Competibacter denitrificans Run_A_D11]|uniref:Toxin n=1 Tax=Candidatus Competibacter denitrificans Run_A_D11 TaxID=1400863 RepID=W6M564_9GAMM|nr:type II toxin-antitoxin system RelE/ParE family toxin [Candidatus Competibacter denitrificans]CDI03011.1 Toxin ParE1 [Candidatus Competibacter denitrificans Run_A_D11]